MSFGYDLLICFYIRRTIYISEHINYNIRIKKCQEIIEKNYLQDKEKQI